MRVVHIKMRIYAQNATSKLDGKTIKGGSSVSKMNFPILLLMFRYINEERIKETSNILIITLSWGLPERTSFYIFIDRNSEVHAEFDIFLL